MDTFFNILKQGLFATVFVVFAFVAVYVPQLPTSHVEEAQAGGGVGGGATEATQLLNNGLLSQSVVQQTITAGATSSNWLKENVLDGLGWAIAKRIVSGIIRSLINWVNSGFEGSPSFIQDFRGFLLNIADEEIGRVISELGSAGSFICSPFRLDAQISVAMQYQRGREEQSAPTCTLSGIISNIQGFISGTDFSGGLADWFTITSTPQTYTPYGAALSAQATARARLINAQGEEIQLLDFGDGFQSQEICRSISGFTGSDNCAIVTPGRVIADQINNALDTGRQTLVEADEINELISALLGQLANKALTGISGLLGLSGGDGFGGYSGGSSYLDDMVTESDQIVGGAASSTGDGSVIDQAIDLQTEYRSDMIALMSDFIAFATTTSPTGDDLVTIVNTIVDINTTIASTTEDIAELELLADEYDNGEGEERIEALITFTSLNLPTEAEMSSQLADWREIANELGITNFSLASDISAIDPTVIDALVESINDVSTSSATSTPTS